MNIKYPLALGLGIFLIILGLAFSVGGYTNTYPVPEIFLTGCILTGLSLER